MIYIVFTQIPYGDHFFRYQSMQYKLPQWQVIYILHRNPSKRICHRTCQNNNNKNRAQILDHNDKDLLSAEGSFSKTDLFFYAVKANNFCYE